MVKAVLFDLDGTLLPMDNDYFLKVYLPRVGACIPGRDAREIAKAIMEASLCVMRREGGEETNAALFARHFTRITGLTYGECAPLFDRFYEEEFPKIGEFFPPEPLSREIVALCRRRGWRVVLATVPLFPRSAILARVRWAGLAPEDFALYTCYEEFTTTKPSPAYYLDIAERIGAVPEECLMVGNDASDDIAPALQAGMSAFFLDTHAIGEAQARVPRGGYQALYEYLEALEDCACS